MPQMNGKSKKVYVARFLLLLFFVCFSIVSPLPTLADQNISVTGSIPPKASDFTLAFTNNPTGTVTQNTTITYTITYGSNLYYAGPLTVEAQWTQGTIQGAATPSVDGLDYVAGSAGTAYGSTAPTIDLVNKKIDWAITSFPAQTTGQTVTFTLKTNSSYTGTNTVTFPVSVKIITPNFTTTTQSIQQTYQYNPALAPTATPASATPTPTITPTVPLFSFSSIDFRSVTPTSISLAITLSQEGMVTAAWGTTKTNLPNTLTTKTYATDQIIVLDNLTENTTYYVRLTAQTPDGKSITSDLYVFHTGKLSELPQVDLNSLAYIANDILLFSGTGHVTITSGSPTNPDTQQPIMVLPQGLPYTLRFKISNEKTIKKIQAILRNKNVLGITTANTEEPNTQSADLVLTQDGYYQGRLKSPTAPGLYEEFLRIYDTYGNIIEQKIADIHVSTPFQVIDAHTKQPIEAAQLLLYYQDPLSHTFVILPPQLFPVKNPSFTSSTGDIQLPLPAGVYKAHLSALGYKSTDVVFTLGSKPNEGYPQIQLIPQPFSLATSFHYFTTIATDTIGTTKEYVASLSHSLRFFELNALIVTTLLVLLTFLSFLSRLRIPLSHLPFYLVHIALRHKHSNTIKGRLINSENNQPIVAANVYLLSMSTRRILSHCQTNLQGEFFFSHAPENDFSAEVLADGFERTFFTQEDLHLTDTGDCMLKLQHRKTGLTVGKQTIQVAEKTLSLLFEVLLTLSLLFELSLGYTLGWRKAAFFLIFSVINVAMWILHLIRVRNDTETF